MKLDTTYRWCATAVAVIVLCPALATAASRAPDLAVAAVSVPDNAVQGSSFPSKVKLANRGSGRAGASTVRLYLSTDSKKSSDDVKLSPAARFPGLKAGATSKKTIQAQVPTTTPLASYRLIACADATNSVKESNERNNCKVGAGSISVAAPPTSHELIEADIASGAITAEQGLIYKVFSDFDDPRLPARYEAEPNGMGHGALGEAAEEWENLSPAAQQSLRPFLIPPHYAGSYWDPAAPPPSRPAPQVATDLTPWCSGTVTLDTWNFVDTPGGEVRIWWLATNTSDDVLAHHFVDILDKKILPAAESIMGRGLKSDGGGGCDGGTGALDIALVDAKTATTYADSSCGSSGTSAHMIFPRTAAGPSWAGLDPYLAHEVMHAIQFAMPLASLRCGPYKWVRESTAEWFQDYVTDPSYGIGLGPDDTEFQAARIFMSSPEVSLDVEDTPEFHDYGAYLLPFWAVRNSGPNIIHDIWANVATQDPLPAVDAALPGGFHDTWADFTLANWNQGPVRDYRDWDGLTATPKLAADATVPVDEGFDVSTDIPYLASRYYRFNFAQGVKMVRFFNPFVGDDKVTVRAVVTMVDGSQKIEDWSDKDEIKFCRDLDSENVREVVVIVSNRSMNEDDEITEPFGVLGEKQGCVCKAQVSKVGDDGAVHMKLPAQAGSCPGVTGTYTATTNQSTSKPTLTSNGNFTTTINFVLKPVPDDPSTDYPEGNYAWEDAGTTVTVTGSRHSESNDGDGCTLTEDETHSGGTLEWASASTDEDRTYLRVDVDYNYEWSLTRTYGGKCAALGSQTGTDTVDWDLFLEGEPSGDGTFTYHREYHNTSEFGSSDQVEDGSWSIGG